MPKVIFFMQIHSNTSSLACGNAFWSLIAFCRAPDYRASPSLEIDVVAVLHKKVGYTVQRRIMVREFRLTRHSTQKQTVAQDTRADDTLTTMSVQRECTTRMIQRSKISRAPDYLSILETLNPHERGGNQHPILPHP